MPTSSSVEPIRSPMSCVPGYGREWGPASGYIWSRDQKWSSILGEICRASAPRGFRSPVTRVAPSAAPRQTMAGPPGKRAKVVTRSAGFTGACKFCRLSRAQAERFLEEFRARLAKFGLDLSSGQDAVDRAGCHPEELGP